MFDGVLNTSVLIQKTVNYETRKLHIWIKIFYTSQFCESKLCLAPTGMLNFIMQIVFSYIIT